MPEDKPLMDALMKAIELEKETFDLYTKAEQKTFNPEGKRIFRWLAKSEETHYLKLTELYTSLHEGGRWVFYGRNTFDLEPADESQRVGFETNDLDALKIALEIEKRGLSYYEQLIESSDDFEGSSMLKTLRDEEKEHIRIISEKLAQIS